MRRSTTPRAGTGRATHRLSPSPARVGTPSGLIPFPDNCALVTILRDGQVYVPDPDQPVEAGDELLLVVPAELEDQLEMLLAPEEHRSR